jgi:antitoxin PrlF
MRVTSKGQVTIPRDVRKRLGITPGSEVDFQLDDGGVVRLVRARTSKGKAAVARMIGQGTVKMTTDEIMALTRGED